MDGNTNTSVKHEEEYRIFAEKLSDCEETITNLSETLSTLSNQVQEQINLPQEGEKLNYIIQCMAEELLHVKRAELCAISNSTHSNNSTHCHDMQNLQTMDYGIDNKYNEIIEKMKVEHENEIFSILQDVNSSKISENTSSLLANRCAIAEAKIQSLSEQNSSLHQCFEKSIAEVDALKLQLETVTKELFESKQREQAFTALQV